MNGLSAIRLRAGLAAGSIFAAAITPSIAQAQTVCLYLMLIDSHEMAAHCGDNLDPASQARYDAAIGKLASFDIGNPRLKGRLDPVKSAADYQKKLHDRYAGMDQDVCKGGDYPHWKLFLQQKTSADSVARIDEAIKKQNGPDDRICL